MVISKELELAIANNHNSIKSIEINYEDGQIVSGFIKEAEFMPLKVSLCKHQTEKNSHPYHQLDFEGASRISILYYTGEIRVFE
ncbi:MAG: hypothetical protein J0L87_11555 [Bacteroidetes bacterium]|nr:hypothetical protein [Bacteroidota bacterium]